MMGESPTDGSHGRDCAHPDPMSGMRLFFHSAHSSELGLVLGRPLRLRTWQTVMEKSRMLWGRLDLSRSAGELFSLVRTDHP